MTAAKISVTFTQKISEKPYETSDYSLTVETTVPEANVVDETQALFAMAKSEVLKPAGQEFALSDTGVVMRKLKSAVPKSTSSAPSAPAQAPTNSQQSGPTATSIAAPPAKPSGGTMTGRVYKRVTICVGKKAELNQAAFNILAFQPAKWDDNGREVTVY